MPDSGTLRKRLAENAKQGKTGNLVRKPAKPVGKPAVKRGK